MLVVELVVLVIICGVGGVLGVVVMFLCVMV